MVHFLGAVVMPRTPSKAPRIPGKAVGMINDMKELKTFLEGDSIDSTRGVESAISEDSWFRIVLDEHLKKDASFQRALELCTSILACMQKEDDNRNGEEEAVSVNSVRSVDAVLLQLKLCV
jgi:hypothetical protein